MKKERSEERREPEIVYSRSVKAGKRIYYLDVKKARNEDLYLCITESKKTNHGEQEPTFEKHKLFLYKEDFSHFVEGLEDVIGFVKNEMGDIEEREAWVPAEQEKDASAEPAEAPVEAPVAEAAPEEKKRRFGFFRRG